MRAFFDVSLVLKVAKSLAPRNKNASIPLNHAVHKEKCMDANETTEDRMSQIEAIPTQERRICWIGLRNFNHPQTLSDNPTAVAVDGT